MAAGPERAERGRIAGTRVVRGVFLGLGFGALLDGTDMPFALEAGPILTGAGLILGLGLIGATIATARIASVEPVTALGENR